MTQKKVPNAVTGGIDVRIGEQKYTLLFSDEVIMEIEEDHKIDLYDSLSNLVSPRTKLLATVLNVLLKHAGCKDSSFKRCFRLCSAPATRAKLHFSMLTAWANSLMTEEQVEILDPTMAAALTEVQQKALKAAKK